MTDTAVEPAVGPDVLGHNPGEALPSSTPPPGAGGHGPPPVPNFNIVPVRALPIVAAVLVGLIVAIATNNLWALTFFHVAGGGLWTSLDLFLGLVLGPIMGSMTIPADEGISLSNTKPYSESETSLKEQVTGIFVPPIS